MSEADVGLRWVVSHNTTADRRVTRRADRFVKGDAWMSVTASNVSADGLEQVEGYVVVVNAIDAAVLPARAPREMELVQVHL